jgi:hypothetical protein
LGVGASEIAQGNGDLGVAFGIETDAREARVAGQAGERVGCGTVLAADEEEGGVVGCVATGNED